MVNWFLWPPRRRYFLLPAPRFPLPAKRFPASCRPDFCLSAPDFCLSARISVHLSPGFLSACPVSFCLPRVSIHLSPGFVTCRCLSSCPRPLPHEAISVCLPRVSVCLSPGFVYPGRRHPYCLQFRHPAGVASALPEVRQPAGAQRERIGNSISKQAPVGARLPHECCRRRIR